MYYPVLVQAGTAYTISGCMQPGPWRSDREKLAAIDAMTPGVVAVFAGNGIAGVVVDGGIRDLGFIRSLDLPVMVRYRTPAQAIGRWKVTAVQEPVKVRGALQEWVTVNPGDAMVAELAASWESKDQAARADIQQGMRLLDALDKHGAL